VSNEVTQFVDGALRASPPITVSAASVFGLGLEDWMYIATIVYTVLQGSYLSYHWRRSHKRNLALLMSSILLLANHRPTGLIINTLQMVIRI